MQKIVKISLSEEELEFHQTLIRIFDICFALIGMVVTLFLSPFIVLLVQLNAPGPLFYSQKRVGRHGRHFTIYKFRTLPVNAEAPGRPEFSGKNDPRVRRIAKFLRDYRIDELPQFLNILLGEMSMVGPRPERPEMIEDNRFVEEIEGYNDRHKRPPGLTGLAQISEGYASDLEATRIKTRDDLLFINNYCLQWYFAIILLTPIMLLRGEQVSKKLVHKYLL